MEIESRTGDADRGATGGAEKERETGGAEREREREGLDRESRGSK